MNATLRYSRGPLLALVAWMLIAGGTPLLAQDPAELSPTAVQPAEEIFLYPAGVEPFARADEARAADERILLPTGIDPSPLNTFEDMRVDDGTPALRLTQWGGILGAANRFDPMDAWDDAQTPPRALRIRRIHFVNAADSPTGPMNWYVWEENGGHKPDDGEVLLGPITVDAGPGETVIDLEATGQDIRIDPPRQFHVGIADVNGSTPLLMLDDGAPYVGGTGDFHASYRYDDTQLCPAVKWGLLAVSVGGEPRSPTWIIWLEVEFDDPPTTLTFTDITDQAGAGSRTAWGDFDNDGWEDLLVNGTRLWANNGDGTFTDVTATAGLTSDRTSSGIFGDYDNDGDLDIFQSSVGCEPCQNPSTGTDRLWRNEGDGTFTDVLATEWNDDRDAPIPHDYLPTESAAWGDFNNDGWLDLYLVNFIDWDTLGGDLVCYPDALWINDGPPDFTFTDASSLVGIDGLALCGRGAAPADFDADGDQDIFVSNYTLTPDLLWVNQGIDERDLPVFTEEAATRGVQGTDQLNANAFGHGIGSSWGDMDRDGNLDLIVGNLAHSGWLCFSDITMLFQSSGGANPSFTDIAPDAGIVYNEVHSDASFADWDNDGHLDVYISHVYDGWRSQLYRSRGTNPPTFELVTHDSGIYTRSGWGTGWADFDKDGDLDLATRRLYSSNVTALNANHWLQVALIGTRSTRDAVGARVSITHGGITQVREVDGTRGISSQDSRVQHFGLGADDLVDELRVDFPRGCSVLMSNVTADQRLEIEEPACLVARFGGLGTSPFAQAGDGRSVCLGDEIQFEDLSQGNPVDWRWDFDGDTVFDVTGDPSPTWTYASAGVYQVTLEVDDGVETDTWTAPVLVSDPNDPTLDDPGNVLRAVADADLPPDLSWFDATPPPSDQDFILMRGIDPSDVTTPVTPTGFRDLSFEDTAAPAEPLLFYRLVRRSQGGCLAEDPFRP